MTIQIHSPREAKAAARVLQRSHAEQGIEVSFGKALDMVARMAGVADWNALAARFDPDKLFASLHEDLREHMEESGAKAGTLHYGNELALVAHNGFQLRYPADDFCQYVRVCDPLGREIQYFSSEEWYEDPECTMGSILGTWAQGKQLECPSTRPSRNGRRKVKGVDGPFLVMADGEEHDEVEHLSRALKLAKHLFENSCDSVEVLAADGTVVFERVTEEDDED